MLVEDWRPELLLDNVPVDNISPSNKVFFIDIGHHYFHKSDIVNNTVLPFEESKYLFRSPTGILKNFYEQFDSEYQAKKYVIKHGLPITWEELAAEWAAKGTAASTDGTLLHAYGEAKWNGWDMPRPDHPKADFVDQMYAELSAKYKLAKTELLTYSLKLRLAGQVDLLLRNKETNELEMYDYKFIKAPLPKKSFYNFKTKQYKMMKLIFSGLYDTNLSHYSIQLSIYQYLMGALGRTIKKKYLIVVTPEKYEIVECLPIKIWVDKEGYMQARYKNNWGKMFDSSKSSKYKKSFKLV